MSAFGSASCGTFSSSTMIVMMTAITPSVNASSRPLVMSLAPAVRRPRLKIGGEFPGEPGRRYFLASARILARPERREIAGAFAFGSGAPRRDGRGGRGKRGRGTADRTQLLPHPVHNSEGGPAREEVRERGVPTDLPLQP